ncbi:MAG: hypothetical protein AUJ75_03420 [Candidatus Omnitrophica bacterium CG1_02_49_10]|nr:MAG: hypothetical protein AUJ75_03420 [Candidatus Omnitrophica bacterium CG1_02_49_10]
MENILNRLKREILVCDGAMGTMLQEKGLGIGEAPEIWNISNKEAVKAVHKSYIDAGADMVITNSFGANEIKLKKAGLDSGFKDINLYAAALARAAAGDRAYVLGDLGPTGEFLVPVGTLSFDSVYNMYCAQVKLLKEGGANCIIIETMTDLGEMRAALKAAKDIAGLPIIVSMTFQKGKEGFRTMMGVSISDAVKEAEGAGADIIGSNCGNGTEEMAGIAGEFKSLSNVPVIIQPNAGLPKLVNDKTVFDEPPGKFAAGVSKILDTGINIIGGCCGTGPAHIKKIKELVGGRK